MILIDAGPLIALIDRDDPHHRACVGALRSLEAPLYTTWPVLTEAMHVIAVRVGPIGPERLLRTVKQGAILPVDLDASALERVASLMKKYRDVPMDFGDASLVVLAQQLECRRVFTLDRDFLVFRLNRNKPFELLP